MQNLTSKCARSGTSGRDSLSRSILFHAAPSVSTLFVPALADVRILSAMPQLPEDELTVAPPRPQSAPTRRRSCRPGTRAWSWKRQDRAVRAIPLAQVSLYAAVRRGRSVPHAPCGARALTGHPHPVLAQAREVKQRLSDRFLAQGARGRERVNTARSDPTAAVTIAYLSPAQGLLRRRRHHWSTCPWWTRRMCRPALSARKISSAPPRRATFSSTRRWNGVRSETRPRALPPTADKVRVLPTRLFADAWLY